MLMQCPRCGFSQPEDQYCAQCGVNMQSYKRKEKPILKKIFQNLGFQIFILLIIAGFAGTYMIGGTSSAPWVQKLGKFEGPSKSTRQAVVPLSQNQSATTAASTSANPNEPLQDLTNKEIAIESASANSALQAVSIKTTAEGNAVAKSGDAKDAGAENTSAILFKLTYAEVSTEVLAKWITASSRIGLYQSMQDYSAGILPDFRKRGDPLLQVLKTAEKKLSLGQAETNLSGTVSDDGSQMIGLSATYDIKAIDANTVHGSLYVTRANRQNRENFPAEFDLPKGSVFFMVDTLTRQQFRNEKKSLTMAPFQILNSLDFNAQKSKFVIILEPEIK